MISPNHIAKVANGLIMKRQAEDGDPDAPQISATATFIFILTMIVFSLIFAAIAYTYDNLIVTLCMVESSSTNTYVPIQAVEPTGDEPPAYSEDGILGTTGSEINIVRTQPITASLRATVRHLRARAGFRSLFRGLSVFLVWNFAASFIVGLFSGATNNLFVAFVASIFAQLALANVHMTWIHVVISEPSTRPWYRRMPYPSFRAWKKIAPAVAIWAVSSNIVNTLPLLVAGTWGTMRRLRDPEFVPDMKDAYATAGQLFMAMFLTILLFVLLQVPATVAMVRVAASMLPEEDETIVQFDRTFGGLTTPEIIGGQGKIGIVEAWRSFNWECRRRLLKLVVKVAGIILAAWLLFTFVTMVEAHVLFGPAFGRVMKNMHGIANRGS